MQPDDEQARRREAERGIQARAILESPLWDESYTAIINDEMSALLAPGTPDDKALECKRRILALNQVKQRLATVMQTGQLADQQLKEWREQSEPT